jgi:hypothetical protein
MKITETIKENTIQLILSGLFAILGFLIGSIYSEAFQTILPTVLQEMSKTLILKMLLVAIIICVLLIALSFAIYFHFKTKLIPKFGVVWDKNKEPYCPTCEKPLAKHLAKFEDNIIAGIDCVKCKKSFTLLTDEGGRITLIEAKQLL